MKRRWHSRKPAITAIALLAISTLAAVLVLWSPLPLPDFMVRSLALHNTDWILANYRADRSRSRMTQIGRDLFAAWLEHNLVLDLERNDQEVPGTTDDAERLRIELEPLQTLFVAPDAVGAAASRSPAILRGTGYCDQINGFAAHRLARSFPHAQAWALVDPETGISPHTIGRVWSDQRNEWLYFDTFFQGVTIFRRNHGTTESLHEGAALDDRSLRPRDYPLEQWYGQMVDSGYVLVEYGPSFAGDLWFKTHKSPRPRVTSSGRERPRNGVSTRPPSELGGSRVARSYLQARMIHLLDGIEPAATAYRRTAALRPSNPEEAMLVRSAAHFAQRAGHVLDVEVLPSTTLSSTQSGRAEVACSPRLIRRTK